MIFGFNTEVEHGETVYHLQSEYYSARDCGRLETQVFVSGKCVGTKIDSIAEQKSLAEWQVQERLKEQHRAAVAAVREGRLSEFLSGKS